MVSESNHQQAVIKWSKQPAVRERYPELALLHHIKNETKEGATQVAVDKAMGVKKGVPDLCLPVPRGTYHGLYIEMKRADGGSATKEQKEWLRALDAQGYAVTLCHGWQAAAREIETYLKLPKGETEHDRKTNGGAGQAHAGAEADGSGTV